MIELVIQGSIKSKEYAHVYSGGQLIASIWQPKCSVKKCEGFIHITLGSDGFLYVDRIRKENHEQR